MAAETIAAILEAVRTGTSIADAIMGDDEDASEEQRNAEVLIKLIQDAMKTEHRNRVNKAAAERRAPIAKDFLTKVIDPSQAEFSPLAALAKTNNQQSFSRPMLDKVRSGEVDPTKLTSLSVPPVEHFTAMREKAAQMTKAISAENLYHPEQSALTQLNNFSNTRGRYLSNDGGANEVNDENMAARVAGPGNLPARDPARGSAVTNIPTTNRPGDGWSPADIAALQQAKASGASDEEMIELMKRLKNDGR